MRSSLSSAEGVPPGGWRVLLWCWGRLLRVRGWAAGGLLLLSLLTAAARGLELWALMAVIDGLLGGAALAPLIALYGGLIAAGYGAGVAQGLLRAQLDYAVSVELREQLLTKVASLPLEVHERPQFHDQLHLAGQAIPLLTPTIGALNELLQQLFSAVAYLVVAATLHWSLPIAFLLCSLPALLQRLFSGADYTELLRAQSGEHRRVGYLAELLTSRATAAEVSLFGLSGHLLGRWRALANRLRQQRVNRVLRHQLLFFLYNLLTILGTLWGLSFSVRATLSGQLSLGGLVAALEVLYRSGSQSQQVVMGFGKLYRLGSQLGHLQTFLAGLAPEAGSRGVRLVGPIRELRLEGVGFTYPGAVAPTLCNVNCTLQAGERVALVGANGAGKSTLAYLLLGLYQPTRGRLLVNGIDSRDLAPGELWRQASAIFQEFERFELTLADNLDPGGAGGAVVPPDLAVQYPDGLATLLGRRFGGREPSFGQWQRLAALRALGKPASLLVLDEPTAALDPEAEVALYEQVLAEAPSRLTLLISHRLGICPLADRIFVLERGQLIEEGTHGELVQAAGRYQEIYATQAAWYQ